MKQNKFGLVSAFIAAAAVIALRPSGAQSSYERPRKRSSWFVRGGYIPHQGDRERARRRRQIERGQLKAENGLARSA
jgi:hypothetical protein